MKKGFSKDFYLVLIGQIISLFGNAVIRFALPLHLLSVTHSPSLLGIVSGFAFLPLAVMSPVGGLIADRVNKRNIMVVLDFFTAGLVLAFLLLSGRVSLVGLILVMLFLLYGISGAYQPSVQASIPLLVTEEAIMPANALINMISSLSGLLGPALGGIAYGLWGITPILYLCAGCFFLSALMELFIHIPFTRKERTCSLFRELAGDIKESLLFITREKKEIGKLTLCCTAVNFFLSALMIISLPVIVMQILSFPKGNASEMYGFLQALMAAGGLAGGMAAGIFSKKLNIRNSWKLLFASSLLLIPMGAALQPAPPNQNLANLQPHRPPLHARKLLEQTSRQKPVILLHSKVLTFIQQIPYMQYHYNLQGARIISTSALHAACPSPGSPSRPGITRILPDGILYGRTEADKKRGCF